ncbi:MAG: radical SAM protein [Acetobacteraceae bacterium]|nr:radical SAM protein [Acetobacteraceae bacterium]
MPSRVRHAILSFRPPSTGARPAPPAGPATSCLRPTGKRVAGELPDETFLALAGEAAALGVSPVNITGGEPLLKAELVLEMTRRLKAAGCSVHLLTNAELVTEQLASELREAGVVSAQVSLDGASAETHDRLRGKAGSYAAALRGIERLRAAGVFVNTATVVSRANYPEREAIRALASRVADAVKISPQLPIGRGASPGMLLSPDEEAEVRLLTARQEDGSLAYSFMPRDRCSIGSVPVVTPDGCVFPCMLSVHPGLRLGRYPRDSLAGVWRRSRLLRRLRAVSVEELEPCSACERRYFCGGGCRASAYFSTGSFAARDPARCAVNARIFKALLERGDEATRGLAERCRAAAVKAVPGRRGRRGAGYGGVAPGGGAAGAGLSRLRPWLYMWRAAGLCPAARVAAPRASFPARPQPVSRPPGPGGFRLQDARAASRGTAGAVSEPQVQIAGVLVVHDRPLRAVLLDVVLAVGECLLHRDHAVPIGVGLALDHALLDQEVGIEPVLNGLRLVGVAGLAAGHGVDLVRAGDARVVHPAAEAGVERDPHVGRL